MKLDRRTHRPATLAVLLAASALALGACGDDDETTSTSVDAPTGTSTESAAPADEEVQSGDVALEIADFSFIPEEITVEAGSTLTWTNADDAGHTVTADDDSFATDLIDKGGEGEVSFDTAGEFTYYCEPHPFMHGKVTVVEG